MRQLDLFSGIGGFAYAAERVWGDDHEILAFCEIDEFCNKVLNKHWPHALIINDIKQLKGKKFGQVDLITGGFPCQPFSVAGKRKGKKDDRYLWPEMLRVISEIKPRWVVAENVAGIISMVLDETVTDLENQGYETQAFVIPAVALDAPHRRDRVWIIGCNREAYKKHNKKDFSSDLLFKEKAAVVSNTTGWRFWRTMFIKSKSGAWSRGKAVLFTGRSIRETGHYPWDVEPRVGRVVDGIPKGMDRIKSLGNAIVPHVAEVIFKAIKKVDLEFGVSSLRKKKHKVVYANDKRSVHTPNPIMVKKQMVKYKTLVER